jgi:hypothetical protein
MEIVYVGDLCETGSCFHRLQAFRRLGVQVRAFDVGPYMRAGGPLLRRLRDRLMAGPAIARLNRDVVRACLETPAAARIWFDKPLWMRPWALDRLRQAGRRLYSFTLDNPFHVMNEPGWHVFRRTIRQFDVNVVPRDSSVADYRAAGAGTVALFPVPFDPFVNHPATPWLPARSVDVSYVGSPYEERPAFLAALADQGITLRIGGARWGRHPRIRRPGVVLVPAMYGEAYRRAIWDARVNLAFLTRSHHDPCAHKSMEITASGSFLLAVRSDGHRAAFEEGREAEFFGSVEEAADKIRFYLKDDAARERVALAGCRRAWTSGYANDEPIAAVFRATDPEIGAELTRRAAAVMTARRRELGLE